MSEAYVIPRRKSSSLVVVGTLEVPSLYSKFMKILNYNCSYVDIWLLSVLIVMSGQITYWQPALGAGIGSFGLSVVALAVFYVCLSSCIAEIASAIPLSGGNFLYTRCLVGFFPGYVLGCMQFVVYIVLAALTVYSTVQTIVGSIFDSQDIHKLSYAPPLLFALVYFIGMVVYFVNGKVYWGLNIVTAVYGVALLLIFIFGSFKYVNSSKYSPEYVSVGSQYLPHDKAEVHNRSNDFNGGLSTFLHAFPRALWLFMGQEAVCYTAHDVKEPKLIIPRGLSVSSLSIAVSAIFLVFIVFSLPNNFPSYSSSPLYAGYNLILSISYRSYQGLVIPIQIGSFMSFMYIYGKVGFSLGSANIFNKSFAISLTSKLQWSRVSVLSIVVGNVVGFVLCVLMWVREELFSELESFVFLCMFMFSALSVYSYSKLSKVKSDEVDFNLPLGKLRMAYISCISVLGVISVIGFQFNGYRAVIYSLLLFTVFSVYYFYGGVKTSQEFSNDEVKMTFTALIVKHNTRVQKEVRKGSAASKFSRESSMRKGFDQSGNNSSDNSNNGASTFSSFFIPAGVSVRSSYFSSRRVAPSSKSTYFMSQRRGAASNKIAAPISMPVPSSSSAANNLVSTDPLVLNRRRSSIALEPVFEAPVPSQSVNINTPSSHDVVTSYVPTADNITDMSTIIAARHAAFRVAHQSVRGDFLAQQIGCANSDRPITQIGGYVAESLEETAKGAKRLERGGEESALNRRNSDDVVTFRKQGESSSKMPMVLGL